MHKGIPSGELVTDMTEWPPLLNAEEFAAFEEFIAELVESRAASAKGALPIPDVGFLCQGCGIEFGVEQGHRRSQADPRKCEKCMETEREARDGRG